MRTLLTYATAIITALSLLALYHAGRLVSAEVRQWHRDREPVETLDNAFARLDALHVAIFGRDD